MGTSPPPPDDEREIEELIEQEDAFGDVSDLAAGEPIPPEMIPVIEAGGGVSEGFELAEAELIENATDGPLDGTRRIFDDAPETEAEPDRATYGEADEEIPEDA